MNCPLCCKELGENDRLILRWYAPRQWWVTEHLTKNPKGNVILDHSGTLYYSYCMQANIQTVVDVQSTVIT
jgi:hypothetical protein